MKRASAILLFFILLAGIAIAAQPAAKEPYAMQVQKLYSAPDENSNLIFNIPIEVALLDVSEDGNWYKVKIAFNWGPLGYTYVGWANIPVGEALASRCKPIEQVAKLPPAEETK